MRLSRIKIAGFKSFVDPTVLKLPSSLVGIVGPNGCGKSNTIDAVRWVMGESSAKHLRGESMDDVIFTGSSTRKPVGKASVELVFDNSDGSLGGEYAAYAEISIRREVTRDGQSKYALNNVRCRRKDIRDIFLGTGLGPRSYAIIEQGMISRLIEAKPEELRVYLEEAAGISKYKERRKETETRIRHTRENLDRLNDLREEVDKQLDKLKRQARTAERYQELKGEERRKRGELLVLKRGEYEAQKAQRDQQISEKQTALASVLAEQRSAEAAIEHARESQRESSERFSQVQADFYRVGAEVSRIEQSIEHTRDNRRQRSQELDDVVRNLRDAEAHRDQDRDRINALVNSINTDQPSFDALKENQKLSAEALAEAEMTVTEVQERKQLWSSRQSESMQAATVERSRIESLERSTGGANARLQKLEQERETLNDTRLSAAISDAITEEAAAVSEEARLKESLGQGAEKQRELRDSVKALSERLNANRSEIQTLIGRLASLEALQQAALAPASSVANDWLKQQALESAPRLAQIISARPGWEKAVELVLGEHLESVCVDAESVLQRCLDTVPDARLAFVKTGEAAQDTSEAVHASAASLLAHQVEGNAPLHDLLAGIHAAIDLGAALTLRETLKPGESVVTQDGLWMGRDWLRVARSADDDSVLMRAAEISTLRDEAEEVRLGLEIDEEQLAEQEQRLAEHESRRDTLLHAYNDAVRLVSALGASLQADRQQVEQMHRRRTQIEAEIVELTQSLQQESVSLETATAKRSSALAQLENLESEGEALERQQDEVKAQLAAARAQLNNERDAGQEIAIRVQSMRSTREATEQNLTRIEAQIEQLQGRQQTLNELLASEEEGEDPLASLELSLHSQLALRVSTESALGSAREQLEGIEVRLREHEHARQRHDALAQQTRDQLQAEQMASQEVLVRLKTIDEQLVEQEHDVVALTAEMDSEADATRWAADLTTLEQRISRLGPINLAAIDEYAEEATRKEYLDSQHDDVSEALATLERAIQKIDRETRARFRDTYDQVDAKFRHFFPRLFGGGHAALELTGEDLLDTGVSVVAQPPGKRVNNIQLLSGGEKALTAVALVFAFFELNPSPFCMLDEVDAPLDDANVGRFCELVKEMSERVQFIFITHNKVTMELAEQLMGVTMNEPGVSRLVTVDVQEAVELAGA